MESIGAKDESSVRTPREGDFRTDAYDAFDKNRFLGHISKVSLIDGAAV